MKNPLFSKGILQPYGLNLRIKIQQGPKVMIKIIAEPPDIY